MTVWACGLTTIDHTSLLPEPVATNHKYVARESRIDVGGPAANAARVAHALGVPVRLVTMLGSGPLASLAADLLRRENIEIIDAGATRDVPLSSVLVDPDGQRIVVSSNNTGREPTREVSYGDGEVRPGDVILIDGHCPELALPLARAGAAVGAQIVIDGGSWKDVWADLRPLITHAVVSEDFRPEPFEFFSGVPFVARTRGDRPSIVRTAPGGRLAEGPCPRAVEVVETNGAGDVLHGAFAAALHEGCSALDALAYANDIATESVRYVGVLGWYAAGMRPGFSREGSQA